MTQDLGDCCILNDPDIPALSGSAARGAADARVPWIRICLKNTAVPSSFGLVVDTAAMDFVPKTVVVRSAMTEVMIVVVVGAFFVFL